MAEEGKHLEMEIVKLYSIVTETYVLKSPEVIGVSTYSLQGLRGS